MLSERRIRGEYPLEINPQEKPPNSNPQEMNPQLMCIPSRYPPQYLQNDWIERLLRIYRFTVL